MWFLLQGFITFAVVASNIHWHWPNGYLASGMSRLRRLWEGKP
jgi:hypothetical protein